MFNLENKIVLITGASSGIGKACAERFAEAGAKLILTARRKDRLKTLAEELNKSYDTESLIFQLDVREAKSVQALVDGLSDDWKNIDVLINNAGLALTTNKMQHCSIEDWDTMIDTNVKGLLYMTRAILPNMVERNAGHIINIGSMAGYDCYPGGNVYPATKHAVRAISYALRIDLLGTGVRVSEIDPGAVDTEFSTVRWQDEARAKAFYADFNPLTPYDVARSALFCAMQPPHVNIANILLYPTDQASAHHLNRKSGNKAGVLK